MPNPFCYYCAQNASRIVHGMIPEKRHIARHSSRPRRAASFPFPARAIAIPAARAEKGRCSRTVKIRII